jgi:hypothetical protein
VQSRHAFRNYNLARQRAQKEGVRFRMQLRLGTWRGRVMRCDGCKGNFENDPGPVLYDHFWKRICRFDEERLCHRCTMRRLGPIKMWYHALGCPWNTTFMSPHNVMLDGIRMRCWWRGPSTFRLRNYGTYVYDEDAVVQLAVAHEDEMVARDRLRELFPDFVSSEGRGSAGGTDR